MVDTDFDFVNVNLKILSNLEKNKKLCISGNYLDVEKLSVIPESVRRSYRGDSRDKTIKKIDEIVIKAIHLTENNFDIQKALEESIKGLENLKDTYDSCIQTKARLDTIIDKINNNNKVKDT
ncbi:hypothetical protein CPAV1605_1128 [seawater metagenome]|uniref:Uncharacterized protein n=1 Tax=seawater metagenome TaxID=1561972 RepID=A0A5E8CK01_9ZZZZ